MEAMFADDLQRCKEITLANFNKRGLSKRISEVLSYIWEP